METEGLAEWKEGDASPPKEKIKDAKSAHALYMSAKEADRENAVDRVVVTEVIDGEPPYDQVELDSSGHSETVNLNFGEGFAIIEAALTSYNDLTSSVDVLANCHTTFGSNSERPEYGRIISEEWHRMCKEWGSFEFNVQHLAKEFVMHGVSVAFFDNFMDWRWKTSGLGNFLLPRNSLACEEQLDHAIATRRYGVNDLYRFIEDPEVARETGWKVEATKKLIWRTHKNTSSAPSTDEWEDLQVQIKNNDLFFGVTDTKARVNIYFIQEFDGSWSLKMADTDGEIDDFIYVSPHKAKCVSDLFTTFTYGIGNGYYHGIRGLAYKIFPQIQVSNRLRGKVVENSIISNCLLIQPQTGNDLEQLGMVYYGPYAVIPPNTKIIERDLPNISTSVLPVLNDLTRQIQNNTGSYASRAVTPEGQERTKFEVQAQLQSEATLSTSAMNLFYLPWGRLMSASFRRAQNPEYQQDDPGGKELFEMKKRILKRGVPMEAFYAVDRIEPTRAIGYGSPGNRLLALDEINTLAPQFDPVGKRNALRDRVAVRVGYEMADRYVPKLETDVRPPIDAKIAELENVALHDGKTVSTQVGEEDMIHLGIHVPDAVTTVSSLNSQQVDPQKTLMYFAALFPHVQSHMNNLAQDPTSVSKAKQIQGAMQKIAKVAGTLQRSLAKQAMAQQAALEEQAAAQKANGGQVSPELLKEMAEHKVQMDILKDTAKTKMEIKVAEATQKMHLRDVEASRKLVTAHVARPSAP